MKSEILRPAQFISQPWKNGGGTTLELYRFPDSDQYEMRLSVATVRASGPFSKFNGYLRTIIQLEGAPMVLRHPVSETTNILEIRNPYNFDGEWETYCDVTETARDFNVIYRKVGAKVRTIVISLKLNETCKLPTDGSKAFVFCYRGEVKIKTNFENLNLVENELCILTRSQKAEQIRISADHVSATLIVVMQEPPSPRNTESNL